MGDSLQSTFARPAGSCCWALGVVQALSSPGSDSPVCLVSTPWPLARPLGWDPEAEAEAAVEAAEPWPCAPKRSWAEMSCWEPGSWVVAAGRELSAAVE